MYPDGIIIFNMGIEKISYGKTYNLGNYCSHRIDLEASVDDGEDIQSALSSLKQQCDLFHTSNVPTSEIPIPEYYNVTAPRQEFFMETIHEKQPQSTDNKLTQEEKIHNLITQAGSLPELEQWRLLSSNTKYQSLKQAFEEKLLELSK